MQSYHWACHDNSFSCHCQESKQIREQRNMLHPMASKLNYLVATPVRSGSKIGSMMLKYDHWFFVLILIFSPEKICWQMTLLIVPLRSQLFDTELQSIIN
jgi:hypothetical protein